MTCASTVIAMHIETALAKSTTSPRRQNCQIQIHKGLAYLRASSEHWNSGQGILHMLEEIVKKTSLMLGDLGYRKFDLISVNPFARNQNKSSDQRLDGSSGVFAAEHAWNDARLT